MDGFIAVAGTHATRRKAEWTEADSRLSNYLKTFGLTNYAGVAVPYNWSTDLDLGANHEDWIAGGKSLYYYAAALPTLVRSDVREAVMKAKGLAPKVLPLHRGGLPASKTHIISHSHGRQVVLYAMKLGLKVDTWIDVCGPVRDDMTTVQTLAMPNVRRAVHVYSDNTDWTQILGELFGVKRLHRDDRSGRMDNVQIKGVGHSGLLSEDKHFHYWQERGLIAALKGI